MSPHSSTELQRPRYWQGQKLKGKDLRDQMSYNALLQAWHDRALHNAYGVRTGLQVLLENDEVVIRDGIAYDIHGSGLVLDEDRRQPLPLQVPPYRPLFGFATETVWQPGSRGRPVAVLLAGLTSVQPSRRSRSGALASRARAGQIFQSAYRSPSD